LLRAARITIPGPARHEIQPTVAIDIQHTPAHI
jgi:hypothetical protein